MKTISAHWGPKYQKRCLLNVTKNENGSITGIQVGFNNGFSSAPDKIVTIPADSVKKLHIKYLEKEYDA